MRKISYKNLMIFTVIGAVTAMTTPCHSTLEGCTQDCMGAYDNSKKNNPTKFQEWENWVRLKICLLNKCYQGYITRTDTATTIIGGAVKTVAATALGAVNPALGVLAEVAMAVPNVVQAAQS